MKEVIDTLFDEYFKSSYTINDIIYWPGRITLEQYIKQDEIIKERRPMSWCYGSLGILRSIYLASGYMSYKDIKSFAVNELTKIAKLKMEDYLLNMPNICHGFAGTVAIMSEMFLDTGNDIFVDVAKNQMLDCIEYIINTDFKHTDPNREKRVYLYNYLEGYSGMLQVLLSLIGCDSNIHKKRILVV